MRRLSRKGIIVLFIVLILIATVVFIAVKRSHTEEPATPQTTQQTEPPEDENVELLPDTNNDSPDSSTNHRKFGNKVLADDDIETTYLPFAQAATLAYIEQSSTETKAQRTKRLTEFFTKDSALLTAKAPAVDPTFARQSRSTGDIINTTWLTAKDEVTVTLSLKITTVDINTPQNIISSVYQAYDCVIVPYNNSYRVSTITYNPQTIVLP